MKCRQTGINAEVFQRMGMSTVNMPGGEIIPPRSAA
jgi:TRAP-type mannitol/chloroaromatic compound transport system substrate-binding protein